MAKKIARLPDVRGEVDERRVIRGQRKYSRWRCRCLKLLEPQSMMKGRMVRYGWVLLKPPSKGSGLCLLGDVVTWDGEPRVSLTRAYKRVYVVGGDENGTDMGDLLCYALEHWKRCVQCEVGSDMASEEAVMHRVWSYPGWHGLGEVVEVLR